MMQEYMSGVRPQALAKQFKVDRKRLYKLAGKFSKFVECTLEHQDLSAA